jgi:iduronate 2-sulfatase
MKQKTTLTAIGALLPFCIQAENDVRNVLFIAIDDLRPTLGCYGDPYAVTPNIDTFATKSFLFENTYCQQSVSGPSRASLLTGLRPDEIGVTDLNTHFREKCPYITTLPQLFKNNGYETIGIGKIYHGSTRTQDTISWTRPPIYNLSIKKEEYTLMQNRQGNKAATIEIADQPDTSLQSGISNLTCHLVCRKNTGIYTGINPSSEKRQKINSQYTLLLFPSTIGKS